MSTPRQYAVVDFETTGFGSADRVVEIGVVLLDHHRNIQETWETLVQPQRDIANSFVHRIKPSDLVGAPTFDAVAGEFASILNGRTVVAHNASFEIRFLQYEFKRLGLEWPQAGAWIIDTQRLFRQHYPGDSTTLAHALERVGIINNRPHSALADAEATAKLFASLVAENSNHVMSAAPLSLPPFDFPVGQAPVPRSSSEAESHGHGGAWLARLSESVRHAEGDYAGEYRKTLAVALSDRELSRSEIELLSKQALADGLGKEDVLSIHEEFMRQLAIEAWLDGRITDGERDMILALNEQLGLPPELARELLENPQQGAFELGLKLSAGDRVTFTGQLDLPREEWERRATSMGLSVGGVTKKSAVLVSADPDSMSGKARKAREYRVPIVGEKVFAQMLHSMDKGDGTKELDLSSTDIEPSIEPTDLAGIFTWSTHSVDPLFSSMTNISLCLAQEWCAEYPHLPLVEISPQLTLSTPIEVQSSFKSGYTQWFARFPEPLSATVQDLGDLAGVGKHKLVAMVEAVVLAAIDSYNTELPEAVNGFSDVYGGESLDDGTEESEGLVAAPISQYESTVSGSDMALYLGWLQLTQTDSVLPSVPDCVKSEIPGVVSYLAVSDPLEVLFRRAAEDVIAAAEGDDRKIDIVKKRWVGGKKLEEIGKEFGVSRERVRQLENQLRKHFDNHGEFFRTVERELSRRLTPIRSVEAVRRELPQLFAEAMGFGCTFGELFTAVGKQWEVRDGWIIAPGFLETLSHNLTELADDYGVVSLSELAGSLEVPVALIEEFIVCNESLKVLILDDKVLTRVGNHQDRAAGILAINEEPMTAAEIMDAFGGGNLRSASNQFSTDPRLVKVSADQWALKEWGFEEFKTIARWIGERLESSTHTYALTQEDASVITVQAVPLDELLAEADRLHISEQSVRQYASLGDFETKDGMVFERVDESANVVEGDMEDTRDVYLREGAWHLLLTVNKDHMRGSGFAVPLGVAAYYEMKIGDTVTLASPLGEQYVRVNRLKQASISTIKRFLERLDVQEGQRVWLKLGEDKTFDVLRAPDERPGDDRMEQLYNLVGLEPRMIGPGESTEDSLARVNECLGLNPAVPRRRTVATFRHRRQDNIADLIQEL